MPYHFNLGDSCLEYSNYNEENKSPLEKAIALNPADSVQR